MKKRLTRFLPFLLAFTIALPSYSVFAEEENQAKETQTNETNETQADETTANDTLSLAAETAVLIDAASGEILYDKDAALLKECGDEVLSGQHHKADDNSSGIGKRQADG